MAASDLASLIARLEAAEGPSRELDALIAAAINPGSEWRAWKAGARSEWLFARDGEALICGRKDVRPYTASLDSALSLVPPHYLWQIKRGLVCEAIVWSAECDYTDGSGRAVPVGRTLDQPAISLCLAALKARAQG